MATLFEPRFSFNPTGPSPWMAALAARAPGFVRDPRLCGASPEPSEGEADRSVNQWQEGYAAGFAAAQNEHARAAQQDVVAAEALRHAFVSLDNAARQELAARLAALVVGLCEGVLAPPGIDRDALLRQCEAAAETLGTAPNRLTLRLCPADIRLLDGEFRRTCAIVADDTLPRGAIRLEDENGGVANGPDTWALQLRRALQG